MDDVVVERLSPEEAFELVAHETRLHVLRALNEADDPLAFGELRKRVGVEDPGQFNYHLGKLAGRFVREDDEGYGLTAAGRRVVGAVLSGGYTSVLDGDPVPMDVPCLSCGASMSARFHEDGITVGCDDCNMKFADFEAPAGILEGRPREDALEVVDRWLKRLLHTLDYGFCDTCDGPIESTVYQPDDEDAPKWVDGARFDARMRYLCPRCGNSWDLLIPAAVIMHPTVAGFLHEHGIGVRTTPMWELDCIRFGITTVASKDPLRVELPITLDDETRTFVFDADLELIEVRQK